jgi:hypothetical protein
MDTQTIIFIITVCMGVSIALLIMVRLTGFSPAIMAVL